MRLRLVVVLQLYTQFFNQGHVVTVELSSGHTYRGKLIEAEDNMNIQLRDITVTSRDGMVSHLEQVYVRGSHIRLFILPDMLKHAPMFRPDTLAKTRAQNTGPRGGGRGRGRRR